MKAKKDNETQDLDLRNDEILREDMLLAALEKEGLGLKGDPMKLAHRLETHYLASKPKVGRSNGESWHLRCKIEGGGCGYTSTSEQDYCPFCGDGKEEFEAAQARATDDKASTAMVPHAPDGAIEATFVDEEEEDDLPSPGDHEPAGTVKDLDAAINAVNARKADLAEGERDVTEKGWELGCALYKIFKENLYYARRTTGGAPVHASWKAFVRNELGIVPSTANRFMRIAVNFTREIARELGPSKLVELLPAAEAQAAENSAAERLGREPSVFLPPLLDVARKRPVPELRAAVRAALPEPKKPGAGATHQQRITAAAAAKRLAAKQPEDARVTVQRQEGTVKLRFYRSEEDARAGEGVMPERFKPDLVAIETAVNGVEVVYTLKNDAKHGLVLHRRLVRVGG